MVIVELGSHRPGVLVRARSYPARRAGFDRLDQQHTVSLSSSSTSTTGKSTCIRKLSAGTSRVTVSAPLIVTFLVP